MKHASKYTHLHKLLKVNEGNSVLVEMMSISRGLISRNKYKWSTRVLEFQRKAHSGKNFMHK